MAAAVATGTDHGRGVAALVRRHACAFRTHHEVLKNAQVEEVDMTPQQAQDAAAPVAAEEKKEE